MNEEQIDDQMREIATRVQDALSTLGHHVGLTTAADAARAAIEAADAWQGWPSVDLEAGKKASRGDADVLVWGRRSGHDQPDWHRAHWGGDFFGDPREYWRSVTPGFVGQILDVTHWQPLPPPPDEARAEESEWEYGKADSGLEIWQRREPDDEARATSEDSCPHRNVTFFRGGEYTRVVCNDCGSPNIAPPDPLNEAAAILECRKPAGPPDEYGGQIMSCLYSSEEARRFCKLLVEAAVQRVRAELFADDKPPE